MEQKQQLPFFAVVVPLVLQCVAWPIAWLFFNTRYHVVVHTVPELRGLSSPVIFAANHTTQYDPIVVRGALPWFSRFGPMYYVAREHTWYKWRGWRAILFSDAFFRAWGAYPAKNGARDYAYSLQYFVRILMRRGSVTIFPKGMEHPEQDVEKPVRGGVGYLALVTGVPVVPVAIDWTQSPQGEKRRRELRIIFGSPIVADPQSRQLDEPTVDACREHAQRIWSAIERLRSERSTA